MPNVGEFQADEKLATVKHALLLALLLAGCGSPALQLQETPGFAGTRSWTGRVAGDPTSFVTIVDSLGAMQTAEGNFLLKNGEWERVDTSLQRCETVVHPGPRGPQAASSGPVIVDCFFLYNQGMLSAGNSSVLVSIAQAMVNQANACTANSQVDVRFRIVGVQQVDYDQASLLNITSADLEALAEGPQFAAVRARRAQLGADLYCLMLNLQVPLGTPFTAGMARVATKRSPLDVSQGYSVVSYQGLSNMVFAHEVGHNFGCQHDVDQPHSDEPLYAGAFGQRLPGRWGTVMAYAQKGERTLPYFSNPAVTFQGDPTGATDTADNARAMRLSGPTVAGYASATVPLASPRPSPSPTVYTQPLHAGWNAVGFQVPVLTSVSELVGATLEPGGYQLKTLAPGEVRKGCWVYAPAATSLEYTGTSDAQGNFVRLREGWNLVSFATATELPVKTLEAAVILEIQPDNTYASVDVLQPGRACWIYSAQPALLTW